MHPVVESIYVFPARQHVIDLIPAAAKEKILSIPCHLAAPFRCGRVYRLGQP